MPSLNLIYVLTLLSTSLFANALSIAPIGTVVQSFPVTVTWFRETDDPENWVFMKTNALGTSFPILVDSNEQEGEAVVSFTHLGSFDLLALSLSGTRPDVSAFATFNDIFVVSSTSHEATPTQITPSSTVTLIDSSSLPPSPTSLGGTSSVLPSDSSSTGRSQNNANIPSIVGGSVGVVGFFVLILVFMFCRRRGKRGVHSTSSRPWKIIGPFRWSSPGMNQSSDTSARLHDQRVGGERSDSEVATAGHGPGHDKSESSLVTARNARIPVQRQFRIAGRAFTKSKTPLEKRQSDGEEREVSDRGDHGDDERIGDPPAPAQPAEHRSPAMQENGDRTPNILRHLDSGIRIMQLPRPGLVHEQRMTQKRTNK
ncbi:hypothetical protein K435DRAFT_870466 [Dendrothele bispora CBS 962.96]|uniref:Mid2 domain-containing protein n=1 Tax=Dendrothele bispora (strain CBS 962.96) TaxID=1314807 RepID=A0A4S8L6J1_DENBC|nr:hypothetical protein K435DRAFT_870466 [Dendrothele bispora CBS 962.96]